MQTKTVPFIDLAGPHRELCQDLLAAIRPLVESAAFVGGPPVQDFEGEFAGAVGASHAVGVKSGTAAVQLGLQALGVTAGDEMLVPAFTFIATAAPVVHLGATPVFVDVDPETACLDLSSVEAAITSRTRAVVPVHLYGHPADMTPLLQLAQSRSIAVLEDCAQSHLATYHGATTGSLGDAGAFSFYPTKNLGALGDAGACTTNQESLAELIRSLANHGRTTHLHHVRLGANERLDALQAAMLRVKLQYLEAWTTKRRQAARRYDQLLAGVAPLGAPLRLPVERDHCTHVYHLYVTRHRKRDALMAALKEAGIGTATHYPLPIPRQPAFDVPGQWPQAESWAEECLALPLYPGILPEDQEYVAEVLRGLS